MCYTEQEGSSEESIVDCSILASGLISSSKTTGVQIMNGYP